MKRRAILMAKKEKPEDKKRQAKEGDGETTLDFGLGKLSFGGLFKGLGNLIDLASKLQEKGGEIKREGEFKYGEKGKGVFGFTIRTLGPGGKPSFETFGNIKETPKGPVVEEVREPLVDVLDEKGTLKVIAELPGADASDIKLDLKGDILTLKAEHGDRKYNKEILLPFPADEQSLSSSFNNGILEVTLKKKA
jgi:HSP20 family protein